MNLILSLLATTMVAATIHRLLIAPSLMNSSCAWASDKEQLQGVFDSKFTGAVTTRTATLHGFAENADVHMVNTP